MNFGSASSWKSWSHFFFAGPTWFLQDINHSDESDGNYDEEEVDKEPVGHEKVELAILSNNCKC